MSKRSSEAQARAAADRAYLAEVRGEPAGSDGAHAAPTGTAVGGDSAAALPVPPAPTPLEQTDVMPHVPTAAPSPVLGVSPILGDQAEASAPPVGSYQTPTPGPPGPAFPSQAAVAAASTAAGGAAPGQHAAPQPPAPPMSPAAGGVEYGLGPGPLQKHGARREPSFIEQSPVWAAGSGTSTATLAPPQQYSTYPDAAGPPLTATGVDLPLLLGPEGIAPTGDLVTCPECGEMATVDAARRNSRDFCRNCDFPLFWARSTVVLPSGAETGASLRRLPGTVGRAATAALLCPHCGEPNSPAAQTCVRCLLSLHPVEPPPPPPVYVAPPPPPPMPVPIGREYPLWWILLVSGCAMAIILIVVWIAAN